MKNLRIAIAQINPTVGDYAHNAGKIIQYARNADKLRADIVVFPELSLSGYPVWDLANKRSFIDQGLVWLDTIVKETAHCKCALIVGFIDSSRSRRSRNAIAVIAKGNIIAKYYKRLLPTYDVFLEEIFFEPGTVPGWFSWKGAKIGVTICEDIWDDAYDVKPTRDLATLGVDLIVNISASPYYQGVAEKRDALLRNHSKRTQIPILYVNQTGAQDDLIFDGRSLCSDRYGKIVLRLPAFEEKLEVIDHRLKAADKHPEVKPFSSTGKPGEVYQALVTGVREYCRKNRFREAVLGLSGGIDSALVAAIACDALGAKAVKGITMPSPHSSKGSWKDSEDLAGRLGMRLSTQPISGAFQFLLKEYDRFSRAEGQKRDKSGVINIAVENLQSRLRGLRLMFVSNDEGCLLLSTGNKSEIAMGYCTLYGDMCGGLAVIGDVYKTDVYRLAQYRNRVSKVIPEAILRKAPSAELRPNQTDQDSLPPYEILDQILYYYIEKNMSNAEIREHVRGKISSKEIAEIIRKVDHNEYKRRQTPPILRVTEKAWFGRRMPITNYFQE